MGTRQQTWARKTRAGLVAMLGGECKECKTTGRKRNNKLELDCIEPRGEKHHRMEWSQRMSFYRREHAAGNLQLLCAKCHNRKTRRDIVARESHQS